MSDPFGFFDEIYCINLDHRTDRWEHAQNEFRSMDISDRVKRFSAIKEEDGRLGIIKSNLSILKTAKEKGFKNVLIFEDDVKFLCHESLLQEALVELVRQGPWGLFYLGGNVPQKVKRISNRLIEARNVYGVHAMAYHSWIFDSVIKKYEGMNAVSSWYDILDVFFVHEIQTKYPCFLMFPLMATQMESYSDIEKRLMNQSYIEERFKENVQ
jgi:hypothetical protein